MSNFQILLYYSDNLYQIPVNSNTTIREFQELCQIMTGVDIINQEFDRGLELLNKFETLMDIGIENETCITMYQKENVNQNNINSFNSNQQNLYEPNQNFNWQDLRNQNQLSSGLSSQNYFSNDNQRYDLNEYQFSPNNDHYNNFQYNNQQNYPSLNSYQSNIEENNPIEYSNQYSNQINEQSIDKESVKIYIKSIIDDYISEDESYKFELDSFNTALETARKYYKPLFVFLYSTEVKQSVEDLQRLLMHEQLLNTLKEHYITWFGCVDHRTFQQDNSNFFKDYLSLYPNSTDAIPNMNSALIYVFAQIQGEVTLMQYRSLQDLSDLYIILLSHISDPEYERSRHEEADIFTQQNINQNYNQNYYQDYNQNFNQNFNQDVNQNFNYYQHNPTINIQRDSNNIIDFQDREYYASLQADQAKELERKRQLEEIAKMEYERKLQEENRIKIEELERQKQNENEIQRQKDIQIATEYIQSLEEPNPNNTSSNIIVYLLRFKNPDGSIFQRSFYSNTPISIIFQYVTSQTQIHFYDFALLINYPKKSFTFHEHKDLTLEEANISKREQLLIVPI